MRWARSHPAVMALSALAVITLLLAISFRTSDKSQALDASQARRVGALFYPAATHWAALTVEPVVQQVFRSEHLTEGKIAVDEDRATLIFSPYSGRVIKLLTRPGDTVAAGQPLFIVEAADMVQAQNDFINAVAGLNKARSQLELAQIIERQNKSLYETRAAPLRDVQQSQAGAASAENDVRSAETSLEAARNRLRILGKTDEEIIKFSETGTISPQTTIQSPIAGTVVQRKVGPGQYINTATNSDPVFVIGDLAAVWLIAYVRETEAPNIRIGQALNFKVLAFPDTVFAANISYVATALDPSTRRLLVRAVINNTTGLFKPEMFASVSILTGEGDTSLAVQREAVIYEGDSARVWVVGDDKSLESRRIKPGLTSGKMIQVLDGLKAGEKVIVKGSLFIDRAAVGS